MLRSPRNCRGVVDQMGLTALHLAALRGSVPCVTLLVAARAELNAAGSLAPLHLAAQHGHLEAVQMLLDLGAQKERWGLEHPTSMGHTVFGQENHENLHAMSMGSRKNGSHHIHVCSSFCSTSKPQNMYHHRPHLSQSNSKHCPRVPRPPKQ